MDEANEKLGEQLKVIAEPMRFKIVQLLLDKDVKAGEFIGCHPCINTSSLKLYTKDIFEKFLPAVHHEPIFVELTGE